MAEITKCSGYDCNKKETCFRFTAENTMHWQSYFIAKPAVIDGECEMYWKVDGKKE